MPGIASRRWNWVEWAAVPLVCATMVAAWVGPFLQVILGLSVVQPRGLGYPTWVIIVLLLGASTAKNLLPRTRSGRVAGALMGVVAILIVLVGLSPFRDPSLGLSLAAVGQTIGSLAEWREAIPATFLLVVMSAALWARGLAVDWTDHHELWRTFALGVLVLGLLILLSGRGGAARDLALGRAVLSFLLTGLLALALLAALDVLSVERSFGRRAASLNRYWLSAVALALLAVTLVGWLLGQILAPDAVTQFVHWLDPLRRFIGQVLSLVLTAIIYVVFLGLMVLYRLISRWIGQPEPDTSQAMKAAEDLLQQTEVQTRSLSIPPNLKLVLSLAFPVSRRPCPVLGCLAAEAPASGEAMMSWRSGSRSAARNCCSTSSTSCSDVRRKWIPFWIYRWL